MAFTAFPAAEIRVFTTDGRFLPVEQARQEPLAVAAANWAATARLVAERFSTSLLIDVGTTTTDIIPIVDGQVFGALLVEQLEQLGKQIQVPVYSDERKDPVAAVRDGNNRRQGGCVELREQPRRLAVPMRVRALLLDHRLRAEVLEKKQARVEVLALPELLAPVADHRREKLAVLLRPAGVGQARLTRALARILLRPAGHGLERDAGQHHVEPAGRPHDQQAAFAGDHGRAMSQHAVRLVQRVMTKSLPSGEKQGKRSVSGSAMPTSRRACSAIS